MLRANGARDGQEQLLLVGGSRVVVPGQGGLGLNANVADGGSRGDSLRGLVRAPLGLRKPSDPPSLFATVGLGSAEHGGAEVLRHRLARGGGAPARLRALAARRFTRAARRHSRGVFTRCGRPRPSSPQGPPRCRLRRSERPSSGPWRRRSGPTRGSRPATPGGACEAEVTPFNPRGGRSGKGRCWKRNFPPAQRGTRRSSSRLVSHRVPSAALSARRRLEEVLVFTK